MTKTNDIQLRQVTAMALEQLAAIRPLLRPLTLPVELELPPGETEVSLRRIVARLRAGEIEPVDPAIPPEVLANVLEGRLELRREILMSSRGHVMVAALWCKTIVICVEALARHALQEFHAAKQLPEARDPNNPLSEAVRRIHRQRRASLGRPAGTKRRRWPRRRR
jgi:hypothetical protein